MTPENKAKIIAANQARRGRKLTPEHKDKISAANIGRKLTPEQKAKLSAAGKGRKLTPEQKATISAAKIGCERTPEHKAKISKKFLDKNGRPYTRELSRWVKHIKGCYGLTLQQFDKMVLEQCGHCAMCHKPFVKDLTKMHIDHDHETGVVRELVCGRCNADIGFMENLPRVKRVIQYLACHSPLEKLLRVICL